MKSFVSAIMYSGIPHPMRELSDIEIEKIKELTSQLTDKYSFKILPRPGFTGFVAKARDIMVYGMFDGYVRVWNKNIKDWMIYYDTPGICAYLYTLMNNTLQNHYIQNRPGN